MARTAIPLSNFVANSNLASPAGTAGDATNGHIITGAATEEIVLRVTNGGGGSIDATVQSGANPPASSAGQGDLVQAVAAGATQFLGPFTSGRFVQSDGSLWLDLSGATSVTVTAFRVPRTA